MMIAMKANFVMVENMNWIVVAEFIDFGFCTRWILISKWSTEQNILAAQCRVHPSRLGSCQHYKTFGNFTTAYYVLNH